eukprot:Lithocolla_globosa_v1_NODE_1048_length_2918_cov_9.212015.p3 type:complete len:123 gc:universal NODE_1048_length_2918_cov_9.212015:806-1174(+)
MKDHPIAFLGKKIPGKSEHIRRIYDILKSETTLDWSFSPTEIRVSYHLGAWVCLLAHTELCPRSVIEVCTIPWCIISSMTFYNVRSVYPFSFKFSIYFILFHPLPYSFVLSSLCHVFYLRVL